MHAALFIAVLVTTFGGTYLAASRLGLYGWVESHAQEPGLGRWLLTRWVGMLIVCLGLMAGSLVITPIAWLVWLAVTAV